MTRKMFFAALLFCAIPVIAADRYLVKWITVEKCYECAMRHAVICSSGVPDCGVPDKTVSHYREFDSLKEAVLFSNPPEPTQWGTAASGILTITGTIGATPPERGPSSAEQIVGIFLLKELPIEKGVTRTEVPQPAKIEEKFTVKVKPQ